QKMMKYMMVVMCFMFYKVAAGLCVYFVASSLWGLAERKLLPKAKKPEQTPDEPEKAPAPAAAGAASQQVAAASGVQTGKKTGRNKRKERAKAATKEKEQPRTGLSKLRQQVSDWWNDVLEQAKKK